MFDEQVPLWAFLLTAFVAVVGPFLSSLISNGHALRILDKQRDHELTEWLRLKRLEVYEEVMLALFDEHENVTRSFTSAQETLDQAKATLKVLPSSLDEIQKALIVCDSVQRSIDRLKQKSPLLPMFARLGMFGSVHIYVLTNAVLTALPTAHEPFPQDTKDAVVSALDELIDAIRDEVDTMHGNR